MKVVQIQTTSVCNGKCVFCPYKDSWFVKNPGVMPEKLYLKILNDIKEIDPEFKGKFCPYMCNEPFSDKDIIKRIKQAIEILHDPYVEVSSNFVLLTKKKIDELLAVYGQHEWRGRVMISHHGINKAQYERVMGLPWGKALDNLKYFVKQADGRLKLYLHTAIESHDAKYFVNSLSAVAYFWKSFFIDNNLPLHNVQIYPLKIHNRAGNVKLKDWKFNYRVRDIGPSAPFDCPRLHNHTHVLYSGEVVLCCNDYQHETVMGDLNKQSLAEILANSPHIKMAKGEIESPADFLCKRCQFVGA